MAKTETATKQIFALWKKTGKAGTEYFTGADETGKLVAFYNGKKKNPKEPDLRIYRADEKGSADDEILSMWCNVSKSGQKYLTGKMDDQRIVGFINETPKNEKQPYIVGYVSDDETLTQASKITTGKEEQPQEKPF